VLDDSTQLDLLPDDVPVGIYADLPLDALQVGVGPAPDKGLLDSVRRFGLLQPIIATPSGATWQVIDGRRRVLCARELEWGQIPALVLPPGSVNPHVVQLAAHVLRSRNRAAEIDAIEALMKEGSDEDAIMAATGLMKQEIRALLPLTRLPTSFRSALRQGQVAASVALEAAKLSPQAVLRLEGVLFDKGRVTAADVKEQRLARTQAAAAALDFSSLASAVPDYEPPPPPPSPVPGACLLVDTDPSGAFGRELQENPATAPVSPIDSPEALAADLERFFATNPPPNYWRDRFVALRPFVETLAKAMSAQELRLARKALVSCWQQWEEEIPPA
jgi:ParB-like chromosome segregation protein Spo0J